MTKLMETASIDDPLAGPPASGRRRWPWVVCALLLLAAGVLLYNAAVWRPVAVALDGESTVSLVAYRQWLVSPSAIVIDVRDVAGTASMADVDRNLFKAAEALQDREFGSVILAYRGTAKLMIDAGAFQTIGRERAGQNPIYVIRTMQQDVTTLDGTPAFPPLYGGWLYVMGAEMDQHREFHERWWLQDAMSNGGFVS